MGHYRKRREVNKMRIPIAEINGAVYLEKEVAPEELPSIIIPCESEDALKRLIDWMAEDGLFDEGNAFKLLNISESFLDRLNKED